MRMAWPRMAPPGSAAVLALNPTLDVSYEVDHLIPGEKVASTNTRFDPGGTGVNVGRALRLLKTPALTCLIVAGEIGTVLQRLVSRELDAPHFVSIRGETRINCTLIDKDQKVQYEIDGIGPSVSPSALEQVISAFLGGCEGCLGVLTGSVGGGVPDTIYGNLVDRMRERAAEAVVDAKGPLLAHAIERRPFLIKPNRSEFATLVGKPLPTLAKVALEARAVQSRGVRFVCVSLGEEGALLAGPDNTYYAAAPPVVVRCTVGCGDAMVAGLTSAFARHAPPIEALRLGLACGSATAEQPGTRLFDPADVERLIAQIEVRELDA